MSAVESISQPDPFLPNEEECPSEDTRPPKRPAQDDLTGDKGAKAMRLQDDRITHLRIMNRPTELDTHEDNENTDIDIESTVDTEDIKNDIYPKEDSVIEKEVTEDDLDRIGDSNHNNTHSNSHNESDHSNSSHSNSSHSNHSNHDKSNQSNQNSQSNQSNQNSQSNQSNQSNNNNNSNNSNNSNNTISNNKNTSNNNNNQHDDTISPTPIANHPTSHHPNTIMTMPHGPPPPPGMHLLTDPQQQQLLQSYVQATGQGLANLTASSLAQAMVSPIAVPNLASNLLQQLQGGNVITALPGPPQIPPTSMNHPPPNMALSEDSQGKRPNSRTMTNDERRQRRLLRNRVAAKECRKKKKQHIHDMEEKIQKLEEENASLRKELDELKNKLSMGSMQASESYRLMKEVEELNAKLGMGHLPSNSLISAAIMQVNNHHNSEQHHIINNNLHEEEHLEEHLHIIPQSPPLHSMDTSDNETRLSSPEQSIDDTAVKAEEVAE